MGLAAALLAVSAAVAACGVTGGEADRSSKVDRGVAALDTDRQGAGSVREEAAGKEAGADRDPGRAKVTPIANSHIVRTASLTVTTRDVSGGLDRARTAVESAGGYVAEETTDRDSDGNERSRLKLRVPPQEYEDVLAELAGLGKLVERKVSAKDVTDQVVDTESRIRTQKASVARVRALMDKATTLSEVVSLEAELNTRQADLEALQAHLKSLEERTGMATITLSLHKPDAEPAQDGDGDDGTTVGDALAGGWNAFVATLHLIVIVLGAVLPFAVTALVLAGLWRLVRPRLPEGVRRPVRSGRTASAAAPVTAPAASASADAPGETAQDPPRDGGSEEPGEPEEPAADRRTGESGPAADGER